MRNRAFTYITRHQDLLLLDHPDFRYLLPQIPGGTIETDESPADGALREAKEETGIQQFSQPVLLGSLEKDLRPIGRDETIMAWFFHLETKQSTPKRWRHFEQFPSNGSEPIEFELYWVPLTDIPVLGGIDDTMLHKLLGSFQLQDSLHSE